MLGEADGAFAAQGFFAAHGFLALHGFCAFWPAGFFAAHGFGCCAIAGAIAVKVKTLTIVTVASPLIAITSFLSTEPASLRFYSVKRAAFAFAR
jgi:hypothetical protein